MELTLRTTALLGLGFAVACFLRRATPASRHLLWHVTMLLVVAAPLLHSWMPRVPVGGPLQAVIRGLPSHPADVASSRSAGEVRQATTADGVFEAALSKSSAACDAEHLLACASPALVWLAGSLLVAGWFAVGWLAAASLAWHAVPAPPRLRVEMQVVAKALRLTHLPDLRVSASARGPLTVGALQPRILLPATAIDWDPQRRRVVLAHELAHVRRADVRTHALAHLMCALYWFNPLAWLAARAMKRERERACDDAVIGLGIRPSRYAQDLLEIARETGARFGPSAALAMARPSELEGRLLSLLASDRRRSPVRGVRWLVSATMLACAVLALGGEIGAAAPASPPSAIPPLGGALPAVFYDSERLAAAATRLDNHSTARALAIAADDDARESAVLRLAVSGDASAIDALIGALRDRSAQVREKAAMGLARHSSPAVITPLIAALQDPDPQVREQAAAGLMLRRDRRIVDPLLTAMSDIDPQVREKAAMALGTSGDARAHGPLEAATHDPDARVREQAGAGLALLAAVPASSPDRRRPPSTLGSVVRALF